MTTWTYDAAHTSGVVIFWADQDRAYASFDAKHKFVQYIRNTPSDMSWLSKFEMTKAVPMQLAILEGVAR